MSCALAHLIKTFSEEQNKTHDPRKKTLGFHKIHLVDLLKTCPNKKPGLQVFIGLCDKCIGVQSTTS